MQPSQERQKSGRRAVALFSAVLLLVTISALAVSCSNSSDGTTSTTPTTGSGVGVVMRDLAFQPATATIAVAQAVKWTNFDGTNQHSVVADNGEFECGYLEPVAANASGELLAGTSFSFQFENAGTYTYHCGIHPTMTGTAVVK